MIEQVTEERIEAFQSRYLFALFPGGGVALEPASGNYWALNASAAAICQLISGGKSWQDVRLAVSARWGLSAADAGAAVYGTCRSLGTVATSTQSVWYQRLPYQRFEDGHALVVGQRPLIGVDRESDHVRLLVSPENFPISIEHGLRLISPKILAARGLIVLHAATCRLGSTLTAFCGPSGAGKSTVSSTLSSLGVPKLADEILLVSMSNGSVRGYPAAEKRIYQWCAEGAQTLATNPDAPLGCAGLLDAATIEDSLALTNLMFLNAEERGASQFETHAVPPWEALRDVMGVTFLGRGEWAHLRRFLANCRELAAAVPAARARPPSGLAELAESLRTYIVNTAS
jgi:hypothetical protein